MLNTKNAVVLFLLLLCGQVFAAPIAEVEYFYSLDGTLIGRAVNGKVFAYEYDLKGQLLAVKDETGKAVEQYVYDPAGNILSKTIESKTTTFTYDEANQLVSSTYEGKTTTYEYDAAGRLVREGSKTYSYGYLDKILEVQENGKQVAAFDYHVDGQVASATYSDKSESFVWDGLALIRRNENTFINEPHVTGGNPILSSEDGVMFNDMLGNTLSVNGKTVDMTAFGETTDKEAMFTGKPYIGELGYAFLFRNYRADYGKWQTADPLGYPDGWNNLAYVNGKTTYAIDNNGLWTGQIGITLTGGGSAGGTIGFGIAFDYSEEAGFTAGFYNTDGGGAFVGAGGSVSGTLTISGADAINALAGTAMTVGESGGEGISIGGETNIPTDISAIKNSSASFSIGFSAGTPAEKHTFVTHTFVGQIIQFGGTINSIEE